MSSPSTPPAKKPEQSDSILNILINVILPSIVLGWMSKDPNLQEAPKAWHIGPIYAMIIALMLPIGYAIWHFSKTRKFNIFSAIGFCSVLLTGGLTIYLWNKDGSVKPHAGIFFGIKEAAIPLSLALAIYFTRRAKPSLLQTFLYNDSLFDIKKIENCVSEKNAHSGYQSILDHGSMLFALSFVTSSALNLCLALFFFRSFDHTDLKALETYNAIVGRLTFWGFLVIGVPITACLFFIMRVLTKKIQALTQLSEDEIMLPR